MTGVRRWLAVHREFCAWTVIGLIAFTVAGFGACPDHALAANVSAQTAAGLPSWEGLLQCPLLRAASSSIGGASIP